MADDELFEDLEDFSDLDETPSFDFDEDISVPDFGEPEGGEGVSRTFKIVGALMMLAVVVIVVLLVLFAFSGSSGLTANEKTSTAVVQTNVAVEVQYNATLTALAMIEQASQTAVRNAELTATQEDILRQTQAAIDATNAAGTATAEFFIQQTQAFFQTQTQEALNAAGTATAEANKLVGRVVDQEGRAYGNLTLRLYRDDGDGVFSPADRTPAPEAPAGGTGEGTPAESATTAPPVSGEPGNRVIAYGETVTGTLAAGETHVWTFNATANDVVNINAMADNPVQMDMFLELLGPAGNVLIGDDDSGEGSNAAILNFTLPQDGTYTIRVTSVAWPGSYQLSLSRGLPTSGSTGYRPNTGGGKGLARIVSPLGDNVLPQTGGTPQPSADELIQVITTATDGTFDFGSLEPGVYWVELDYNSLPPDLQALVPQGKPLVIKVNVPTQGEITFEISPEMITPSPTVPTSTAGPNPIDMTATAFALQTRTPPGVVTETATPEPGAGEGSGTPVALPTTGFFGDIGEGAGSISGTSGLTVLVIAAAGLVAVVFIARKLRTSA